MDVSVLVTLVECVGHRDDLHQVLASTLARIASRSQAYP
jgi:hypothetical protein